ncbi:MAG: PIN domain-containing protein [archaeon]
MKQFIDSTIIIGAFTPNDNKEKCQNILKGGGVIDGLVLIESFDVIERITKKRQYALKVIRTLMSSGVEIVELTNGIIFESIKRCDKYKLRVFDLIHYTTALLKCCSNIVSYDKDFDKLEIKRIEP